MALDDLSVAATCDLQAEARSVRARAHGNRVTYSPKVFIPLTMLCRDRCGYCTFAKPPARVTSPYLEPDDVVAIARAGAAAGCHEALFTLGEEPEDRYPVARGWLDDHGYGSTVDYLAAMCALVRDETGLLPHANAGALGPEDLARLRAVSASQGMMLESLDPDLACHRGAPDKTPARRLATLEAAGVLAIPFTTGVLVGIGESRRRAPACPAGHRRLPPGARPRPGGHRPELPAQAGHGHARPSARVPPRSCTGRSPWPGSCSLPRSTCRRRPTCPTTSRPLLDSGHRRLGRRVAGHGRPRQPRTGVARARRPARRDRGRPASSSPRVSPSTPSTPSTPAAGSTPPCASPCSTTPTPTGLAREDAWCSGGEVVAARAPPRPPCRRRRRSAPGRGAAARWPRSSPAWRSARRWARTRS